VFMSVVRTTTFYPLACMMKSAGEIGWWVAMIFIQKSKFKFGSWEIMCQDPKMGTIITKL
jgi:hypothetical protein